MKIRSLILASLLTLSPVWAYGQTANGKVTTAAPTYTNNQAAPLSLDTGGGLRVNCVTGCAAGSGVANGQATTAAPTYTNNTPNPLSLDLSGNLRTILGTGTNYIGGVYIGGITNAAGDSLSNATITPSTIANATLYYRQIPFYFNGTTWDRQRGDVNGSWMQGNVASGSGDAGNPVKIGGILLNTLPVLSNGQRGDIQLNPHSFIGISASGTIVGDSVSASMSALEDRSASTRIFASGNYYFNGSSMDRQRGDVNGAWIVPSATSSGTSNFSAILANSTNSTLVKNAAGIITEISVYNSSATIAWLKLYNASSAPTCGSGTPVGRYMIPGAASGGAGSNVSIDLGKAFSTGIAFCVTTGIADTDTGAVAASTYTVNMTYK